MRIESGVEIGVKAGLGLGKRFGGMTCAGQSLRVLLEGGGEVDHGGVRPHRRRELPPGPLWRHRVVENTERRGVQGAGDGRPLKTPDR